MYEDSHLEAAYEDSNGNVSEEVFDFDDYADDWDDVEPDC